MHFSVSLTISGLGIERSDRDLCRDLSFSVQAGEAIRILGENGAGKSSLLKVVAGVMSVQEGQIFFADQDVTLDRRLLQQTMIYIGHSTGLKERLSVAENIAFYSPHAPLDQVDQALRQLGLFHLQDVLVKSLSAGQARRVALARLWFTNASLWLLDEPFAALDASGVAMLEAHIQQHLSRGGMVLLTTHQAPCSLSVRELALVP
ncbi:cytochrome c biogenesis heme-transporting ATPase CcmA [Marinomonas sp. A79]|uniref:Cytochrome c biogenesis heme-transporting ATPase CcmA n=1 Tax=Marinomonas vulgaris TaxID=2823372 RepID=A0ABS5HAG9_9GAMM|nr:cytochrome c biogenesis heme-transporting ATPase CcmA [Marinomonas vulgaris]MBR7888666.1 cytochrome c biogenesis heme-transporting ATPase CcmA [Marinomonas vulgaris]